MTETTMAEDTKVSNVREGVTKYTKPPTTTAKKD